jgi:hypothetical protein
MIDSTISKKGIEKLEKFFDEIYLVEPPYVKSDYELSSEKRKERYGAWVDYALTKWQIFRLTKYSKVLICDIDTLANADYTSIFSLKTPAWTMIHKKTLENKRASKIIGTMKTGDKLTKELVEEFTSNKDLCSKDYSGFTPINTSLTLVKPSLDTYNAIMDMVQQKIDEYGYYPIINSGVYGVTPEESAIFEYFHCFTNKRSYIIGPEFLVSKWLWRKKHSAFRNVDVPIITNYDSTDKPWLKTEKTAYEEEMEWVIYKKELDL